MNNLELVMGIEVHAELLSKQKIYSPVEVTYKEAPNTFTNIIDVGYPGVLPTLSREVVDLALKAALALNCEINQEVVFDRKNYFYPDTPKAFQITQDRMPIGFNGYLDIEVNGMPKRIGITRLHMEEDAGKSVHSDGSTLIDYNRQGVPLIEIVTDASIRTPEEAGAYIDALRDILIHLEVSDGKMEAGSMRCDANISVRPYGASTYGVKNEIKNINSISNLKKALEIEARRQMATLFTGGIVEQMTWRYDDAIKTNVLMRKKGSASDYRYFPEPDLSPMYIDDAWMAVAKASIPELPQAKVKRLVSAYKLQEKDVKQIIDSREMTTIFEDAIAANANPTQVMNWMVGEIQQNLNKLQKTIAETGLTGLELANMIALIDTGEISSKIAKNVVETLLVEGGTAEGVVEKLGVRQISDPAQLLEIVTAVLSENAQSIADFKEGKNKAVGFLIGQIMQKSKGQANPKLVNTILMDELKKH